MMDKIVKEMKMSEGFVYFSFGEVFIDETFVSIRSLLTSNPGAKVCLITDHGGEKYVNKKYADVTLDCIKVVPLETSEGFWAFRLKLNKLSPYDKTLFLDGDTYITSYICDLFDLADTFDFVAVPDESYPARGFILGLEGGYRALGYYNCGFFIFRKSAAVDELFNNWLDEYKKLASIEPGDQGPLVRAIIKTNIRFITLPKEYNLRLINKCVSFQGRVKIIHSRARDPEKLARKLNAIEIVDTGSRVWIPHFQTVIKAVQYRWYYNILRLLSLDNVQESSGKKETRFSEYKKIMPFLLKKIRNIASLAGVVPKAKKIPMNSPASAPEKNDDIVDCADKQVLDYVTAKYHIKSFLGFGEVNTSRIKYIEKCSIPGKWVGISGTQKDEGISILHDLNKAPYTSVNKAELVWYEETLLNRSEKYIRNMLASITANSSNIILMNYGFYPYKGKDLYFEYHPDAFWTQLVCNAGFYFEPYLTLELRKLSGSKNFRKTGLAFIKVKARQV